MTCHCFLFESSSSASLFYLIAITYSFLSFLLSFLLLFSHPVCSVRPSPPPCTVQCLSWCCPSPSPRLCPQRSACAVRSRRSSPPAPSAGGGGAGTGRGGTPSASRSASPSTPSACRRCVSRHRRTHAVWTSAGAGGWSQHWRASARTTWRHWVRREGREKKSKMIRSILICLYCLLHIHIHIHIQMHTWKK